jgi:hypothetical protein
VSALAAAKAPRPRPIRSEALLDIFRSERCRLRVERVQWNKYEAPVLRLVVVALSKNGAWIVLPHRPSVRQTECERVGHLFLAEGAK